MWNDKRKAITFSFDDGLKQDVKVIEILNKYNLKATFNLNSAMLGQSGALIRDNKKVRHDRVSVKDVKDIYNGHEVACHTLSHPKLTKLSDEDIAFQINADKYLLESLVGYQIYGFAYPCGMVDKRICEVVKNSTDIAYARIVTPTYNFDLQNDLFAFAPTCHVLDEKLLSLAKEFLESDVLKPQLFYIWGHGFEFDQRNNYWERFETFCKMISGYNNIYYGTNKEVLLDK